MTGPAWITPDWPAPPTVRALATTRSGGVSEPPYGSLNLAGHVGDEPEQVQENRRRLRRAVPLPAEPLWLAQAHGTVVVDAACARAGVVADGSFSRHPGLVCTVLTADCLPLLLCDTGGTVVAAVHAGWRGLAAGIIEQAVRALGRPGRRLLAWLGPAIGPTAFEVGPEVRQAFIQQDAAAEHAFHPGRGDRYLANLYALARQRLARVHVTAVYGGHWCTVGDAERFFSYRRDGLTGRMAALVWLAPC
ncbi:MAG TPA: peptidoglycan editing factor PgeF [Gammaproteobacteria bacterium]|nr:peptidoglycan editing factor PgeF [Gammaproteobacteria bacterium]